MGDGVAALGQGPQKLSAAAGGAQPLQDRSGPPGHGQRVDYPRHRSVHGCVFTAEVVREPLSCHAPYACVSAVDLLTATTSFAEVAALVTGARPADPPVVGVDGEQNPNLRAVRAHGWVAANPLVARLADRPDRPPDRDRQVLVTPGADVSGDRPAGVAPWALAAMTGAQPVLPASAADGTAGAAAAAAKIRTAVPGTDFDYGDATALPARAFAAVLVISVVASPADWAVEGTKPGHRLDAAVSADAHWLGVTVSAYRGAVRPASRDPAAATAARARLMMGRVTRIAPLADRACRLDDHDLADLATPRTHLSPPQRSAGQADAPTDRVALRQAGAPNAAGCADRDRHRQASIGQMAQQPKQCHRHVHRTIEQCIRVTNQVGVDLM